MDKLSEKLRDANLWIFAGLIMLILLGMGSAALLEEFGILETAETEISQSVLVNSQSLNSGSAPVKLFASSNDRKSLRAGSDIMGSANISNRAETIAPIDLVTSEDGNYEYNMTDVRYDYILIERFDRATNETTTGFNLALSESSYLAEGGYRVSSYTDVSSVTPRDPQISGANFHLSENESKVVDPFSDQFISLDYEAGDRHGYPETSIGEKPSPGVIGLSVSNTSILLDGEAYNSFEILFDPSSSRSGNFSFDRSQSYIYKDGRFLTEVNNSVEESIGKVRVNELSILSGSVEDEAGSYHLVYSKVNFLGDNLIDNRIEIPEQSGGVNRFVLQPESEYVFAGSLRSSVFADPERVSHYKLQTSLEVPS